jgi:hypothetical protein
VTRLWLWYFPCLCASLFDLKRSVHVRQIAIRISQRVMRSYKFTQSSCKFEPLGFRFDKTRRSACRLLLGKEQQRKTFDCFVSRFRIAVPDSARIDSQHQVPLRSRMHTPPNHTHMATSSCRFQLLVFRINRIRSPHLSHYISRKNGTKGIWSSSCSFE